jgi:hypothetical protein
MLSNDVIWWLTAIDLPTLSGMFALVWRTRRDCDLSLRRLREIVDARSAQMREALSAFKLEVAKNYASITDMKELETRLVAHLLRIESKLDTTAMKTEALRAGAFGDD